MTFCRAVDSAGSNKFLEVVTGGKRFLILRVQRKKEQEKRREKKTVESHNTVHFAGPSTLDNEGEERPREWYCVVELNLCLGSVREAVPSGELRRAGRMQDVRTT